MAEKLVSLLLLILLLTSLNYEPAPPVVLPELELDLDDYEVRTV